MPDLPAGRVTFLFTDIEGSTRLLHALGDRYAEVLTEHRRLLRAAFERHSGVEVDTQGDSFFVAFAHPGEALAAAEESQRALTERTWPEDTALKVRMGLHTGEPLVSDGHYVGIDVHRAARIAAAAHGGQVIVSERTTRLLAADGSRTRTLRDLGAHHLKDLPEPERLFQLVADGLPISFPPPRVHEEAIEAAGLPDYSLPPADVPCPYKGLLPFEPEDSELFFGREHLVEDLVRRLRKSDFLAVVGPSGSGKSSLVRAGVVPVLQHSADGELRPAIFTPGAHPLAELDGPREASLLVVDQFEEVFTLCRDEEERAVFIDALLDAAARGVNVILALRADFYGHCASYPRLAGALEERQALVGPMTEEELRRAIERPGEQAGLVLEPGVVEAILRDVAGQPGALPLLSHGLLETWKRRSGRMLTVIGYLQSGGVQGAIAKTAESVYEALSPEQRALARNIFLRLTELGDGTEDTRRRASIGELIPRQEQEAEVRDVLQTLADARLVTIGERTVDVAHEALIRHWPTLREWLDEDREGRLVHRRLTEAAQEWEALGRDPGVLFRGTRLATTGDWATAHDPELNQLEREFLTTSRQASQAEAERQRRVNRRLRVLLIGALVLLVLAVVAGVVALVQRSHARHAQTAAEAQALRSDAERLGTLALTEPKVDRAMLLGVLGAQLKDLPETRSDLLTVLQRNPAALRVIQPSRSESTALAISRDGRLLVSGDAGGALHFNDLTTWEPTGPAVRLDGSISANAATFSPDGRLLAVATAARRTRSNLYLVDVPSRTARRVGSWSSVAASWGPLRFTRMAFSPEGTRIAVAVATATTSSPLPVEGRLLLLEVPSGQVVWERKYPWRAGQGETEVAFTPQGELVTSARQGETLLWDASTGHIERRFLLGGSLAVSPDGHRLALAKGNANIFDPRSSLAVLDLRTGKHRSLQALPDSVIAWVTSVAFTPNGEKILGRSFEGALRVWDIHSGSIVETFNGPPGYDLAVAPDGRTAASGAQDGSVIAWDLSGARRLGRTFRWRRPEQSCPTTPCFWIAPNSSLMAEALADGTIALVDLRTQKVVATLPRRNGRQVDALAFFRDGRALASGGSNGHVTLWDLKTRSVARTLRFRERVWWVAVSQDGKLLATQTQAQGSSDSRVEVRSLASGGVLYRHHVPFGHRGLEFSPDGRHLVALGCCEGGSTIEVWDARSGAKLYSPKLRARATAIAFSPNGRLLGAGTEDGSVVLLNPGTGTQVGSPLEVATGTVDPISFSPDGRLVVATSTDKASTLWDLESRKRLGTSFAVEENSIPVVRFAPNGDLVIDNLADTAVWPTDLGAWERFACQVAGRDLTRAEWNELLPNRRYQHVCPQ